MATIPLGLAAGDPGLVRLDEFDRRRFASAFARRFGRFAFPDEFSPHVEPLKKYLRERFLKRDSNIGVVLGWLDTLRVAVDPAWDEEVPHVVTLLLVVNPEHLAESGFGEHEGHVRAIHDICSEMVSVAQAEPFDPRLATLWDELAQAFVERLSKLLDSDDFLDEVEWEVVRSDEFTLDRLQRSYELDLDDLSDRTQT